MVCKVKCSLVISKIIADAAKEPEATERSQQL